MPIRRFCKGCRDFVTTNLIHTISLGERDKIYFIECRKCDHVWLSHDVWSEEDE